MDHTRLRNYSIDIYYWDRGEKIYTDITMEKLFNIIDKRNKPPEPECNHRIGVRRLEQYGAAWIFKSGDKTGGLSGDTTYSPFNHCPDCGDKL